ncbi:hypothetical protein D0Y65_037623 [Glycine soja]|uniref:PGG domain-containing protein n=1 Tax=Glycine soja TaxID=3848 RepID=A0A445H151_GLYSO|nr:hypothetical protein D0Y65_037623 [Glycine soja]
MRNNMGKIPIDVFYDEHKKLSEEIKDAAKGIAESGMLLAALVATVAFAAALTVSGEKTNAWFTVFILTNAVALFTSSFQVGFFGFNGGFPNTSVSFLSIEPFRLLMAVILLRHKGIYIVCIRAIRDMYNGVKANVRTRVATSAAASTSPQLDEHIVENEITSGFERIAGSLKDDLGKHILWGEWSEAQTIFDKYPDMVRIPLNDSRRDTALNVAVYGGSITCEEGLVKLMNPEDLLIPNSQERLTVHLAALYGDNKMVQVLSSENVLDKMTSKDIQRLFFYDHRKQHVW